MSYNRIDSVMLTQMFLQGTHLLSAEKEAVNALNVYPVPDGDTGTNMSLTMGSAVGEIQKKVFKTCAEVTKSVAKGSLMGARGNSGVILSQIFRGFSKGCENKETLSVVDFAHALKEASDMAYRAVLKPVEGTILTVIRETAEAAVSLAEEEMLFQHFFKLILEHANKSLEHTPELLAVLKQAGVVDAGGKGLILILEGFEAVVLGEQPQAPAPMVKKPQEAPMMAQPKVADIHFTYCTEFILRGVETQEGHLREALEKMGDSLVFVTDEDLIKVHVHTNNPGVVLEKALAIGELVNIKIENMKEQHHTITEQQEAVPVAVPKQPQKPYGFIAVAAGEGLGKIFKDLGADVIIEGGQTMNPSTEDILNGINQIPADCIFVLPNNSNIILAANQAQALTDRKIIVLPSKSIPQGISAMVQFNPDHGAEENEARMNRALKSVNTLQVTYSVRDTQMGDREILKDDTLGILNGDIVASGKDQNTVILEALDQAITEDCEILTLYYGEGVSADEAAILADTLRERYGQLEVESYSGGQPVYSHLFSIE